MAERRTLEQTLDLSHQNAQNTQKAQQRDPVDVPCPSRARRQAGLPYAWAWKYRRNRKSVGLWCKISSFSLFPLPSSPCECVKSFFPRWINVKSECGWRVSRVVQGRGGRARASKQGEVKLGGYMLGLGCTCSHFS